VVGVLGLGVVWYLSLPGELPADPRFDPGGQTRPTPPPDRTLQQSEREYLWQVEHHGNLLTRYGFTALAKALRSGEPRTLDRLLAADFTGQILREPREVAVDKGFVRAVRQEDAGREPVRLDRRQFVDELLRYRRGFHRPPQVKLALMALNPTRRDNFKKPWRGTCQLRMWGQAGPGQPREVTLYLAYQVRRPHKTKLKQGGWLRSCAITQSQTALAPHFLMREVAAERGINTRRFHDNWVVGQHYANTGGVYLCDFDRDGRLDLLVTDLKAVTLYKGLPGGKFKDVTRKMGLPTKPRVATVGGTTAAFVDLDGDGWVDLILGDRVYRNVRGKKFVDVTRKTNLHLPGDLVGIAVADYDRDGRMDLFVMRSSRPKNLS
jgi:hypothetical protein